MAVTHTQSETDKPTAQTGDADALAHLYKMSTTAGLGSQDYVEINKFAIACLVAGATSAFSLLVTVMLAIPIAGVFWGVIAFRQITHSAGTQTGRGITIIGLILCLGFSLGLGGKMMMDAADKREASVAMDQLVVKFSDAVVHHRVDEAYGLFSEDFQGRVKPDFFAQRVTMVTAPSQLGSFQKIRSEPECIVEASPRGQTGAKQMIFVFANGEVPAGAMFLKVHEYWLLDDIPGVFAQQTEGQQ